MRVSICRIAFVACSIFIVLPVARAQVAVETPATDGNVAAPSNTPAANPQPIDTQSAQEAEFSIRLTQDARSPQAVDGNRTAEHYYSQLLSNDLSIDLQNHLIATNPLGIEVAPVEAPLRLHLKLPETEGLIVVNAPPESEGAKAGLKQHDVILRVVEAPVADVPGFVELLKTLGESPLRLAIVREGKPLNVDAVVKAQRVVNLAAANYDDFVRLKLQKSSLDADRYRIGVSLSDVDATLRAHLKLPEGHGLVVTEVLPGTAAAEAGVQANDILTSLDSQPLTTVDKINEQVQAIADRKVTLKFLRAGEEQSIEIAPRKNAGAEANAPMAAWMSLAQAHNCQSCHKNPHGNNSHFHIRLRPDLHVASGLLTLNAHVSGSGDATASLNQLKGQLAEMQATIAQLEAAIASSQQEPKKED